MLFFFPKKNFSVGKIPLVCMESRSRPSRYAFDSEARATTLAENLENITADFFNFTDKVSS